MLIPTKASVLNEVAVVTSLLQHASIGPEVLPQRCREIVQNLATLGIVRKEYLCCRFESEVPNNFTFNQTNGSFCQSEATRPPERYEEDAIFPRMGCPSNGSRE